RQRARGALARGHRAGAHAHEDLRGAGADDEQSPHPRGGRVRHAGHRGLERAVGEPADGAAVLSLDDRLAARSRRDSEGWDLATNRRRWAAMSDWFTRAS